MILLSSLLPFPPCLSTLPSPLVSGYVYCDQLLALERVSTGMGGNPPEYLCGMSTPLQLSVWQNYLVYHPDQQFAQFILRGIQHGFNGEAVIPKPCMSNMLSAKEHPQVVASYLEEDQKNTESSQSEIWPEQLRWGSTAVTLV